MLVGLPLAAVLLGAGVYAYLNKEKFGFGGGGGDGSAEIPTAPVAGATPEKAPIIPDNLLEDILPGGFPITKPIPDDPLEEPPPALQVTAEERQQILSDSERTLNAFLLAGTVDELLHYVADREIVEPEIREYYKDGKRTPIATQKIEIQGRVPIPDTNLTASMYWVTSRRRQIPVSVEETKEGYRVDWAAFTQFHDGRLENFIRNPGSEGGAFYVQLRRSTFIGNTIPDIDDLQAFRVQSPIAPFTDSYVFLRKDNPEAEAILERYRWLTGYRPVVELKWVTPKDSEPRIEMPRVVRHTWRR